MKYADTVVTSQYSSIDAKLNRLLNIGSIGDLNVNPSPSAPIPTAVESISKLRAALNAKSSSNMPQQQQPLQGSLSMQILIAGLCQPGFSLAACAQNWVWR